MGGKLIWFTYATLLILIVAMLLAPTGWLNKAAEHEHAMSIRTYSAESMEIIDGRANRWYDALLVNTGIEKGLYDYVNPTARRDAGKWDLDSRGFTEYMAGRVEAAMLLAFMMLRRISSIISWSPFLLLIAVPAAIDGYLMWRIKKHGYQWVSPTLHRYAWRAKAIIVFAVVAALFTPLPIPPELLPITFSVFALALGLSISNMPKRY